MGLYQFGTGSYGPFVSIPGAFGSSPRDCWPVRVTAAAAISTTIGTRTSTPLLARRMFFLPHVRTRRNDSVFERRGALETTSGPPVHRQTGVVSLEYLHQGRRQGSLGANQIMAAPGQCDWSGWSVGGIVHCLERATSE